MQNSLSQVKAAKSAVEQLMVVVSNPAGSRFQDVLHLLRKPYLFDVPDARRPSCPTSHRNPRHAKPAPKT